MEQLPSQFQKGETVNVCFPGNAVLKDCTVIKVSFPVRGQILYDVAVPIEVRVGPEQDSPIVKNLTRLHAIREFFLRKMEWAIDGGAEWAHGEEETKMDYIESQAEKEG